MEKFLLSSVTVLAFLFGTMDATAALAPAPEPPPKKEEPAKKEAATFTAIVHEGTGSVALRQTGKENVTADNPTTAQSRVENGVLYLSGVGNYVIEVKEVTRLEVSGAGDIDARDVKGKRLEVVLSGAGQVKLAGEVEEQQVALSGAGTFNGEGLKCKKAAVVLSGAGNAVVQVSDSLRAEISGAGNVEYLGTPKDIQEVISGAGEVRQRSPNEPK